MKQFVFDCAIPCRPSAQQPGDIAVAVLFRHGPLRNLRHYSSIGRSNSGSRHILFQEMADGPLTYAFQYELKTGG
jgi:hypothetical protein